ncbi:hypothetical protein [Prochlorococcus sp. MIT 1223]|nr:hypothetical protein [Prochlorococcus sp. MIT 1223]
MNQSIHPHAFFWEGRMGVMGVLATSLNHFSNLCSFCKAPFTAWEN